MKHFKVLSLFLITLILSASITGCQNDNSDSKENTSKLHVSVSFFAMEEFAKAVGGDRIEISRIIPDGVEPHNFEPKPSDLKYLSTADVFIYNGFNMEPWAESAIESSQNSECIVIESAHRCTPILVDDTEEHPEDVESEHPKDSESEHHHEGNDPHTWLSIQCAKIQVQEIADGLSIADPEGKEYYQDNATSYISKLDSIYTEYSDKFASIDNQHFVTGHAAFAYFCRDYNLEQNSVSNVFATREPSAQQLTELIKYCKENHVTTIFTEELASPLVSETLASELGAKVQPIHTLVNSSNNKSYLELMHENHEQIYQSLKH